MKLNISYISNVSRSNDGQIIKQKTLYMPWEYEGEPLFLFLFDLVGIKFYTRLVHYNVYVEAHFWHWQMFNFGIGKCSTHPMIYISGVSPCTVFCVEGKLLVCFRTIQYQYKTARIVPWYIFHKNK